VSKYRILVKFVGDLGNMDNYDLSILRHLQVDGRISNLQLAEKIHLSPPQTLRRVRALEEANVIRAYTAQVSPEAIGLGVMAFVSLSLDREQYRNVREIERNLMAFPDIIECHTISGDFDYLLKVVASDLKGLSQFLTDKLMQVPGVGNLRSMICMEEIKPVSSLPIR
jgi:Lrp/AsnC family leucine-responsive transcriptional regulator